ncbi:MAG: calcium-binding EGF-like domain-containing protein [Taibaiella sp.]|nr:calcium-binding EGF-like domain-containing protein [Taibaiella sp.]
MKARFKTIVLSALGTIVVFSALLYSSCSPDKCHAIACAYGGVCTDGNCICPTGYEGTQCEKIVRDKFVGTWVVYETGTLTGGNTYTVAVEPNNDSSITSLKITNFYNSIRGSVIATVNADSIYINKQVVDGDTIIGTGFLEPDAVYAVHGKLTMRYVIKNGKSNYFGFDSTGSPSVWAK